MSQGHDELEALAADAEALYLEPRECFDAALAGWCERADGMTVLAYSRPKVLEALMAFNGWTDVEALEWYEFNTAAAWMGPGTPVFLEPLELPPQKRTRR